jgi:hypothetical protein
MAMGKPLFARWVRVLRGQGLDLVLKTGLMLKSPRMVGWVLVRNARPLSDRREYTVLCLGRSIFVQDVAAMVEWGGGRVRYIDLHKGLLNEILCHFMSGESLTEQGYHTPGRGDEGKRRYYRFLKKIFPILKERLGFDAVLSGNIGYVEQQELSRICSEVGIPFLVLHKEGMAVPGHFEDLVRFFYKECRFLGSHILCYNERVRDALLRTEIPGVTKDKMSVVGVPRLDPYFACSFPKGRQVVFFSFFPRDTFSYFVEDADLFDRIGARAEQFHKLIMTFAREHPDVPVIIKTKVASHYRDYVERIREKHFGVPICNLRITNSGIPFDLIQEAQVVVAFNSTTLIETMLAGKPILAPYFGDILPSDSHDYFISYPDLIHYIKEDSDLERCLSDPAKYVIPPSDRRARFLTDLMYVPDGQAGRRAEQCIVEAIVRGRKDLSRKEETVHRV